jgi:heme-degrading monooxygenase HmoA
MNVEPRSLVHRVNGVVPMTRPDSSTGTITLVNVFDVEPERLDRFLDAWRSRTEFISAQPGFRSLRVLCAASAGARFQAIVEAEWDSVETLRDVACKARFAEGARRVVEEVGAVAYPGVYRIAWEMPG